MKTYFLLRIPTDKYIKMMKLDNHHLATIITRIQTLKINECKTDGRSWIKKNIFICLKSASSHSI